MKKTYSTRIGKAALAGLLCTTMLFSTVSAAAPTQKTQEGYRSFAYDSAGKILSQQEGENTLYSPISLYTALSMLTKASTGTTQRELLKLLNASGIKQVDTGTKALMDAVTVHSKTGTVDLANSLWLSQDARFQKTTLQALKKNYAADLYRTAFGTEESAKKIGAWVSKNTKGLLGGKENEFKTQQDDLMVLLNTLYFSDRWQQPFEEESTEQGNFTLSNGKKVKTSFMQSAQGRFYVENKDFSAVALPFQNGNTMIVFDPQKGVTPADLLQKPELLSQTITKLQTQEDKTDMRYAEVTLKLPKFQYATSMELKSALQAMGVKKAFTRAAEFTPLTKQEAWVSRVKQEATIAVDEGGCEAAAYTAITIATSSLITQRYEMNLDHPFVYVIVGADELPLFIGTVENPNQK